MVAWIYNRIYLCSKYLGMVFNYQMDINMSLLDDYLDWQHGKQDKSPDYFKYMKKLNRPYEGTQTIHLGPIEYKGEVINSMVEYYRSGSVCFVLKVFFFDKNDGHKYNLPYELDEVAEMIESEEPNCIIVNT